MGRYHRQRFVRLDYLSRQYKEVTKALRERESAIEILKNTFPEYTTKTNYWKAPRWNDFKADYKRKNFEEEFSHFVTIQSTNLMN